MQYYILIPNVAEMNHALKVHVTNFTTTYFYIHNFRYRIHCLQCTPNTTTNEYFN